MTRYSPDPERQFEKIGERYPLLAESLADASANGKKYLREDAAARGMVLCFWCGEFAERAKASSCQISGLDAAFVCHRCAAGFSENDLQIACRLVGQAFAAGVAFGTRHFAELRTKELRRWKQIAIWEAIAALALGVLIGASV
jgi:hypothetical protein